MTNDQSPLPTDFVEKLGGSTSSVIQGGALENVHLSSNMKPYRRSGIQAVR